MRSIATYFPSPKLRRCFERPVMGDSRDRTRGSKNDSRRSSLLLAAAMLIQPSGDLRARVRGPRIRGRVDGFGRTVDGAEAEPSRRSRRRDLERDRLQRWIADPRRDADRAEEGLDARPPPRTI